MRVVALSYAYPPLRYPRAIQVARLVAHLGIEDVHVVCAHEDTARDASLERAYGDTAPVTRVSWSRTATLLRKLRYKTIEQRLLVPDDSRPWVRAAVRATRPLLRPGGTLVTFGQPMSDHLAGLRLRRRAGTRWVAHFSDPWVESSFRQAGRLTRALNERLERAVIARADAVVFTSAETVDLVMANYPTAWRAKVHVVPHAYDPALYPESVARDGGNGVVLRYIGNFYGHRGPGPLLRALAELATRNDGTLDGVKVEFVGSSEHPLELPKGLPDGLVRVREPVAYVESLALMRASDLLLVLDAPGERSVFLPSKLIDYLGARRPILALTPPGPAAEIVREAGGWVADPGSPAATVDALAAAIRGAGARRGDDTSEEVAVRFEVSRVAADFTAVIEAAAGGGHAL
jgi:glycosyltransferase involved in cell wall biosynthesis